MMSAKTVPSIVAHQGSRGGRQTAISQAVTSALRSVSAGATGRPRSPSMAASQASAVTLAIASCAISAGPNSHICTAMAGSMATSTVPITRRTLVF